MSSEIVEYLPPAPPQATWTPRLVVGVDERAAQLKERDRFHREILKEGVHYGKIPGTDKPTLYKPGAEQLLNGYGLGCRTGNEEPSVKDFTGRDHDGETFIEYVRYANVYRQTGPTETDRVTVAQLAGSCNSWEPKYRYRFATLKCPECGKETVLQNRPKTPEDEDKPQAFFCWRKKGGCGKNFAHDDQRIVGQKAGRVPNENVAELANTILKMADKRAIIASTLVATGCSDIFTQDVEDFKRTPPDNEPPPPPEPPKPRVRNVTPKETPPRAVVDGDEKQKQVRRLFALADEYERIGGERGADFKARLHDDDARHAMVQQMYGRPGLSDLDVTDVLDFIAKVQRRIDEATAGRR